MTRRGQLRIYQERGADVVVGFVETHGRTKTADLLTGLEIIPRKRMTHRGHEFTEMDVDAILARKPEIAVVDELAHTNVPGSRNEKRWQDIEEPPKPTTCGSIWPSCAASWNPNRPDLGTW